MQNNEFEVNLNTVSAVQEFVKTAESITGEVTVISGSYTVNGKSILGVLSLDLSHPIKVVLTDGRQKNIFEKFYI